MPRMDVTGAIGPAFDHMMRVLFRPFVLKKWLALGFLALFLGGGGGHGGSGNVPSDHNGGGPHMPDVATWFAHYWPFLIAGIALLFLIGLIVSWISSVFRFVYIDDIVRNSGAIKEPFARLKGLGTSLFLWNLVLGGIFLTLLVILVGVPLLMAFVLTPSAGDVLKVLSVVWAVLAFISLLFVLIVIDVLVRHFVTAAMYVRQTGIMAAWGIMLPILRQNLGQVFLYFLVLFALGIGIALASLLVALAVLLVLAIPIGGLALVGFLIGQALHLTWTVPVIVIVAAYAFIALMLFVYLVTCAVQPAYVFLQSLPLVVLGQADPSLATLPTARPQPVPPAT